MKLSDILETEANEYTIMRPTRGLKIKRKEIINKGNDKIVYLGTDAIQRSHSGFQTSNEPKATIPKINRKNLKIKTIKRIQFKKEEPLWLDNPTCMPCSTCGY